MSVITPFYFTENFIWFEFSFVFVLGLVLGSFSTAIAYRVPRSIPWAFPKSDEGEGQTQARSACPNCKHLLGPFDLVPFFSWLCSQGKCRYCKARISPLYPAVELSTAALCLLTYVVLGNSVEAFFIIAALPFLMALFVIDNQYLVLPNQLVGILAGLGAGLLLYQLIRSADFFWDDLLLSHIGGALVYALAIWGLGVLMSKVLQKDSLGFGDVKFFAVAGLWLGLEKFPLFCLYAGMIGVIYGLIWRKVKADPVFPFGPALIISFYILLLFPGSFLL